MIYLDYTDVIECILQLSLPDSTIRLILDELTKLNTYIPETNEVMIEYEVN